MATTKIEWTELTWNPTTGCTKISTGCQNCYAERMAKRLKAMGQINYQKGFEIAIHEHSLAIPLKIKKPSLVFVNSMSDLFHENIPLEFILKTFEIMRKAHWHTFQILTKRSERLNELDASVLWPENVWMGVTIESSKYLYRIKDLKETHAKHKFLSIEPLLDNLGLIDLSGIDWIIVGGESGPKARPVKKEWVMDIRDQCLFQKKPFFFKQWGGTNKKKNGRLLDGQLWDQKPQILF